MALTFWGNPTRNKNTQAEIDAYMKANPNVKIEAQPGIFSSYWEKLATQTAGGTAPDIIQMDMAYISEYGHRGALLDLAKVDTSKFVPGTVDSGKIEGKTETATLLVENQYEHFDVAGAYAAALVLALMALAVLLAMNLIQRRDGPAKPPSQIAVGDAAALTTGKEL